MSRTVTGRYLPPTTTALVLKLYRQVLAELREEKRVREERETLLKNLPELDRIQVSLLLYHRRPRKRLRRVRTAKRAG